MRGRSTGVSLAIGTALLTATGAQAAGFAINNKSASALGEGLAGQAAFAEDATTVYNNPAGMMQLDGRRLSAGLHRVATSAAFNNEGSSTTGSSDTARVTAYIPDFFYTQEVGTDLRAGIGFYSPFGLGLKYDSDWFGRYHTIDSSICTYNMSPAVAWRATPTVVLGASVDAQYMTANMYRAIDFSALGGAPDGHVHLTGDNWAWGYTVGLTWAPSETTRLGAVVHSGMRQNLSGRADFSGVPGPVAALFSDTSGSVVVNLPSIASLSGAWEASDRLMLLADYTRTGWSVYRELRVQFDNTLPDSVTPENWRDVSRYNIGARYRVTPAWLLRTGFSYDETPIPDPQHRTPMSPDGDRRWYSIGARWQSTPDFSVDMAYAFMQTRAIPIDNTDSTGHTLRGTYDVTSSFVAVQGNWRF